MRRDSLWRHYVNLKQYPKYKESGLEHIGKIPEHWDMLPLKRISKRIVVGIAEAATQSYVDKGIPLLRSTNIKSGTIDKDDLLYIDEDFAKKNSSKYLNSNDLLTVRTGNAGQTAVVPNSLNKSQCFTMLITTLEKNYNPSFYSYFLNSLSGISYFDVTAWGTAQKNISVPILKECLVPILPLAEQELAVKYLDSQASKIDSAVDKDKQLIELLEEKRIAIINQTVTRGLDPEAELKDSGIAWMGEIPAEWEVRRINKASYVKRGASPRPIDDPKYFSNDGEYSWVRIEDVTASDKYLRSTTEKLSSLGESCSVKLEPGEIFISIAASVGKPIITKIKCCIHDGFVYFERLKVFPDYLYWIFIGGEPYKGLGKLGTQLNLNTETIGGIQIPFPSRDEQVQISKYLDTQTSKIGKTIARIEERINLLEEHKKSLINSAVTGKIDVREQNGLGSKVFY
jgi:type I restriction enzyme S subunit